jgi:hypothetical protein
VPECAGYIYEDQRILRYTQFGKEVLVEKSVYPAILAEYKISYLRSNNKWVFTDYFNLLETNSKLSEENRELRKKMVDWGGETEETLF